MTREHRSREHGGTEQERREGRYTPGWVGDVVLHVFALHARRHACREDFLMSPPSRVGGIEACREESSILNDDDGLAGSFSGWVQDFTFCLFFLLM